MSMCSQTKTKDRLCSPCLLRPSPAWPDQYSYLFFLHSTRRTYKRSHKFLKLVIQHFLPLHDLHRHHRHSPDRTSFALHSVLCGVSSLTLVLSLLIRLLVSLVLTVASVLVCHLVKNEMKWINVDSKSE